MAWLLAREQAAGSQVMEGSKGPSVKGFLHPPGMGTPKASSRRGAPSVLTLPGSITARSTRFGVRQTRGPYQGSQNPSLLICERKG